MAMGKRKRRPKQASVWVATQDLPRSAAHPFYTRLNQILDKHDFDGYVEELCERFYGDEGRLKEAEDLYRRAIASSTSCLKNSMADSLLRSPSAIHASRKMRLRPSATGACRGSVQLSFRSFFQVLPGL